MKPANLHTDPGYQLYFRNWITLGGNHAVELRAELAVGGQNGKKYSVRRKRWYYKTAGAAVERIEELVSRGVPLRIGWCGLDDPGLAASVRRFLKEEVA